MYVTRAVAISFAAAQLTKNINQTLSYLGQGCSCIFLGLYFVHKLFIWPVDCTVTFSEFIKF